MNPFDTETIELLGQPLDASLIKHRPGSKGMMLKYLSGHDVIAAANRVFGPGAWGYKVISRSHDVISDGKKGPVDVYTCDIELQVQGAAFTFPGDGVGVVNAPYTAESHEQARKTATTDALKRALRHYGSQFGLSLYSEDDYVLDEGTLVQVKDVHPGNTAQPKRIVEAQRATMLTTQATSNHPPHNGEALPASTQREYGALQPVNGKNGQHPYSARLNELYVRAKSGGLAESPVSFLQWVGSLFPDRTVSRPADISKEMIEYLEAHVDKEQEVAPHAQ